MGEAPVKLHSISEYQKYKDLEQPVELFVNFKGEVRCRPLQFNDSTDLRIAFAFAAPFGSHIQLDEEGYPCFQGTRGVCSTIVGLCDHRFEQPFSYRDDDDCTVSTVEMKRRKKLNLLAQIGLGVGIGISAIGIACLALAEVPYFPPLDESCFRRKRERKRRRNKKREWIKNNH